MIDKDTFKLSVIIPCYNESKNLKSILERIERVSFQKEIELILVDNGSLDNTKLLLEKFTKDYNFLTVVCIEKNVGYGHGILQGLKNANGKILGWTHADMQTDPLDFIKAIEKYEKQLNNSNFFIKSCAFSV